jgi:hypothetical protein
MRYPTLLLLLVNLTLPPLGAQTAPMADRAAATAAPAPKPPVLPPAAQPAADKPVPVTKPVDLFNGKDFAGWSYFVSGKPADIAAAISIKDDGVLAVSNKPNGYLVLDPARENYQLHVEYRWTIPNPRSNTNSGILLNISPGELQQGIWPVSFQAQTKVNVAGDIIAMSTAACAEAAAGKTAGKKKDASEKPAGEWNACDITVRGDTIEYSVNGVVQNKVTQCVPSSGKIGFQLEGYAYDLRNLKLSPLEPEKPAPKPATP